MLEMLAEWMFDYIDSKALGYDFLAETDAATWCQKYRTQSPEEFLETKVGVCWDFTGLQEEWFNHFSEQISHDFICHSYFLYGVDPSKNLPSHSFTVIEDTRNHKFAHVEYAFLKIRGIWVADSMDKIVSNIVRNMKLDKYKKYMFEYHPSQPEFHGLNVQEMYDTVIELGKEVDI